MSLSPAASWRWLIGLLVASLAVNAFIAGAVATDYIRVKWPFAHHERRGGGSTPPQLRFELAWLKGRLPPDAIARVEAAVTAARPSTEEHLQNLRRQRRELGVLLAAQQPDRSAIDAKLAEIRNEVGAMQAEVQRVSTDTLIDLPPELRTRLAEPKSGRDRKD